MPFTSIHGRKLGFDDFGLLFNGNRIGEPRGFGRDFYVDSVTGAANSNGSSPDEALLTIDAAFGKVTASKGDRIIVMPGHVETISSATGLLADVAGVEVIGMGLGSVRPTITFDTIISAAIVVSAANITFRNMIFTANFADITAVFSLTTAKYFRLEDCYIKATATNMNFLNVVDTNATSADADGLTLIRNKWIEPDLATLSLINMDGTNADVRVIENFVQLGVNDNKSALMTVANGKVCTNLQILRNIVYRLNTDTATGGLLFHTNGTTNSGIVAENYSQHADTAAELIVTASSGLGLFQNYSSGVLGNSGYIIATIDT